ncbi:putative methyltransferase-domain-containing protein [Mycena sanguinolenta]|nr:putative methyltransferase-domain-containing protein [Mycena sanguinolenta]
MAEEDDISLGSLYPEEPRPATPEPTIAIYERDADVASGDWQDIKIRLVGSHPLWGHHLWNAARAFASYLDHAPELYRDQCVLELGAGGGLPGIVAAKNGAKHVSSGVAVACVCRRLMNQVLLTDYPDPELVANLDHNVRENLPAPGDRVSVKGYIWGRPVEPLLDVLPAGSDRFHLVIMSDLLFNHSQHDALLETCANCLASTADACVLVFYTHHRPHLADRDMEFFSKARGRGWTCEEVVTRRFAPMFAEDGGSEEVRSTVHGWKLSR